MTPAPGSGPPASSSKPPKPADPGDKLPAQAQITAELGISPATARRACRELTRLGLIRLIPGHGYYPGTRP